MPWHQEPKKDVISCEKLWGGANIQYIHRYPNEETLVRKKLTNPYMSKVVYGGERGELKHLSTHRKRKKTRFLE